MGGQCPGDNVTYAGCQNFGSCHGSKSTFWKISIGFDLRLLIDFIFFKNLLQFQRACVYILHRVWYAMGDVELQCVTVLY